MRAIDQSLKYHRQKSIRNQIEYTELNKTIRKIRRQRKRKYRTNLIKDALEKHKGPKTINRKLENSRKLLSSIRDKDGKEITDKTKIINTIAAFYTDLYNSDRQNWRHNVDWSCKAEHIPPIL